MRINNNLMAMNTHRQLGINSANGQKSIEKLSSGLRINRAGDDAAGLAISEKMRGQIRGLNQASRNAQDAISLIQTAEGALNETHAILQRMRELAVQASNDTNTGIDRGEIQKEINQLTSEINRIGNTTEFNTMKLLDGSRANTLKNVDTTTTKIVNGTAGSVTVNSSVGVTFTGTADDKSTWQSAISGGIKLKDDPAEDEAIKWSTLDTTETATVNLSKTADGNLKIVLNAKNNGANTLEHEITINKATLAAGASDGIYKVDFHGVSFDLKVSEFDKAAAGTSSVSLNLATAKGAAADTDTIGTYGLKHDFTSATATTEFEKFTIDGTHSALAGVESIEITTTANSVTVKGYAADGSTALLNSTTTLGTALANAGDTFEYNENGINFKFKIAADADGDPILAFTTNKLNVKDFIAKTKTETTTRQEIDKEQTLSMQIGANSEQFLKAEIKDMRALTLGISSATGGGDFAGTDANKLTDVSLPGTTEYGLDMSSAKNATKAIETFNKAIESVSAERSKLGAYQNRLEHTIKNLDASAENLQASESRIRDVDMAKEMMEFTKNNILQQAAQAMLAQANQAPQGVLQLLR